MSALLTVMCMTLGLNVAVLQEDPFPKLRDEMKALQAERRELAGDIAALQVELSKEMTPEGARKLAVMELRLEEVEDQIEELRIRRHEMMQREKNAEAQRAYEEQMRKGDRREGVDEVLGSLFERLEGMEKAFHELQARLEDQIASGRQHIDEAARAAHEALRLYEEALRRREGEAGERHGLVPPGDRKGGYREIPPAREDGMDPEIQMAMKDHQLRAEELRAMSEYLAKKYRESDSDKEKAEIRAKLEEVTSQEFDLKAKIRELEMENLERKLDALRKEFERKTDQKERLIQRRLEDLIGV